MQILMLRHLSVNKKLFFVFCFICFISQVFCAGNTRIDKTGRFRLQRSGSGLGAESAGDVTYVVRTDKGIESMVFADEAGYRQCFYDEEMNLIKEQKWLYASESSVLVAETFYSYTESEEILHKKQRTITRYDEGTQTKTRYSPEGFVLAESVFELNENSQPKKKPVSSFMKKYDEKGRVIEEQTADKEHGLIKRTFSYDGKGHRPDEKRFEAGKEVFDRTYVSEKDYVEKVLFDDGMAVVTNYENGIKKSQHIEQNGMIIRSVNQ